MENKLREVIVSVMGKIKLLQVSEELIPKMIIGLKPLKGQVFDTFEDYLRNEPLNVSPKNRNHEIKLHR